MGKAKGLPKVGVQPSRPLWSLVPCDWVIPLLPIPLPAADPKPRSMGFQPIHASCFFFLPSCLRAFVPSRLRAFVPSWFIDRG